MENRKVLLKNGQEAILAEYKDQQVYEYKDNPLIEALPEILSDKEIRLKLPVYPYFNEDERNLPGEIRMHCIQRLFQYFQPSPAHRELEQRFSRSIRQGYVSRNIISPKYATDLVEGYKAITNGELNSQIKMIKTKASGFTIMGLSGIGKTTAIERVLSLYPQIIVHSKYKNMNISMYQLTWLKLECPSDGSLKALCLSFFYTVDEILGTNYYEKHGRNSRISANSMLPILAQVARVCGLGVLIIDEIQNLSSLKSGGSDRMLSFFVELVNTIGIPVILIGTMKAAPILQKEFRQARRGSGQQGDLIWDRMKKNGVWDIFLEGMFEYQWTRKQAKLTDEISNVLYKESQGVADVAVKLFVMSQIDAISNKKEIITAKTIKKIARENIKLLRPMLDALESGDVEKIAKYEDLRPINIENFINDKISDFKKIEEIEMLKKEQRKSKTQRNKDLKEDAFTKLLMLGVDDKKAKKYLNNIKVDDNTDVNIIVKSAYETLMLKIDEQSTEINKISNNMKSEDKSDLRNIVDNDSEVSAYDALKANGYI